MLFRNISVFIDMNGFILSCDSYVIRFLLDYFEAYGEMYADLYYLKDKLHELYWGKIDIEIDVIVCNKINTNPLYDLVDDMNKPEDFSYGILDELYNEILYTVNYNTSENLRFSDFSNSIIPLTKDAHCKEICIYSPKQLPEHIEYLMAIKFNSDKVKVITGNITDVLSNIGFDSYFIHDIRNVETAIRHNRNYNVDMVVPLYKSNITLDVDREILDIFIDDNDMVNKYRTDLRGIPTPL